MAAEHERWIVEMFSGLSDGERDRLHSLLGHLKTTLRGSTLKKRGKEARK